MTPNGTKEAAMTALIGGLPVKCLLLNSTHVSDADTQEFVSDVIANEVSGTGYTTGGVTLTTTSITEDDTNDRSDFLSDDVTFSTVTLTDVRHVCFYINTGVNTTSRILRIETLGSAVAKTAEDLVLNLTDGSAYRIA